MKLASGSRPLRMLLDTNVVVAGLLWNGPPRRLIALAIDGEAVELFSSQVLLDSRRFRPDARRAPARLPPTAASTHGT